MVDKQIYLDNQATTQVDPLVFESMVPFFLDDFANPSSAGHLYGERANKAVEEARKDIVQIINAKRPLEIIFTSGATEANNLAILGLLNHLKQQGKTHIVSCEIEHKSILSPLQVAARNGFDITYIKPNLFGEIDLDQIYRAINTQTGLISLMHVNNEIGAINAIQDIGAIAKKHQIIYHCDAAQSFGKLPIDVEKMNIDLLSISAHKIYGPKGIGALYVKKGICLEPISYGGGQEDGLRPGTVAVPLVVGLARAGQLAEKNMIEEGKRILGLRDRLFQGLAENIPEIKLNGPDLNRRIYNNLNLSFDVESHTLLARLWGKIAVSNGSACSQYGIEDSYVLRSIGLEKSRVKNAI